MRRIRSVGKGWIIATAAVLALVAAGAVQARLSTSTSASRDELSAEATPRAGGFGADAADSGRPSSSSNSGATSAVGGAGSAAFAPDVTVGASQKQVAPTLAGGAASAVVVPGSPKVVKTADLRVKLAKGGFGASFDRVASIASANGGFVSSSSTSAGEDARSGDLTVRVPSDRFDAARQGLAALGSVEGESIRGEDVSGQLVDYEARLKSLQSQEDALRVLVGQAKAVGEVLQVQSSLFSVRQQIEQLKAQLASLDQSASLASIHVALFEPGAAAVTPKPIDERSLAHSLSQAVDGMLAVAGGMIVVVGWLVPLAVLGLLVWGGTRLRRRRPAVPVV